MKKKSQLTKAIILGVVGFFGGAAIVGVVFAALFIFTDIEALEPLRRLYINTAMTTFSHQYLATAIFSEEKIAQVISKTRIEEPVRDSNIDAIEVIPATLPIIQPTQTDESILADPIALEALSRAVEIFGDRQIVITLEDISGPTWVGKKLTVNLPSLVKVGYSKKMPQEGSRLVEFLEDYGVACGVNGGGFADADGLGNGGIPTGIIISEGEVISDDNNKRNAIVGFDNKDRLVLGRYTVEECVEMGIRDAVSFSPYLVVDGEGIITKGDGGWGLGPRTAIGQKQTGEVVFIVIDGRQAHSVGATLKEVQDLMLESGCYNASCLDGGSSSVIYYEGEIQNKPSGPSAIGRRLPSAFLIGSGME